MKPYLLVAPTLMALTACGGSSDKSTALFAVDTGVPNAALASGTTFETQSATLNAIKMSYRDDTAELVSEPVTIKLSQDADGTILLTYGDQKFEFGEDAKFIEDDGITSYGFEKDIAVKDGSGEIEYIGLWSQEGDLDKVLAVDRKDYAQVWGFYIQNQGAPAQYTKFVVGAETKSEALGSFTTQDYNGFSYLTGYPVDDDPRARTEAWFEETVLNVNFSENKVTGVLGGSETRTRQYDEVTGTTRSDRLTDTGTLLIKDGTISGNGFTADVVSGKAFTEVDINTVSIEMNGKFYGPEAEQVAGTMSGEFLVGEDKSVAMGWFDAERPAE